MEFNQETITTIGVVVTAIAASLGAIFTFWQARTNANAQKRPPPIMELQINSDLSGDYWTALGILIRNHEPATLRIISVRRMPFTRLTLRRQNFGERNSLNEPIYGPPETGALGLNLLTLNTDVLAATIQGADAQSTWARIKLVAFHPDLLENWRRTPGLVVKYRWRDQSMVHKVKIIAS